MNIDGKAKFKLDNQIVARVGESSHELQDLVVTPTEQNQTFNHPGYYGYNNVTVNKIPDQYIVASVDEPSETLILARVSVGEEELILP